MTEKYNAMLKRWEADMADLPVNSFVRESLSRAIKDLVEAIGDEKEKAA